MRLHSAFQRTNMGASALAVMSAWFSRPVASSHSAAAPMTMPPTHFSAATTWAGLASEYQRKAIQPSSRRAAPIRK